MVFENSVNCGNYGFRTRFFSPRTFSQFIHTFSELLAFEGLVPLAFGWDGFCHVSSNVDLELP